MSKVIDILRSRWFVTFIGALLLSLLIWFIGPLIAIADVRPLDSAIVRLFTIVVVFMIWGMINLIAMLKAKKADQALMEDLAESGGDADSEEAVASDREVAVLNERMQDALDLLKTTRLGGGKGGRKFLYQLPWYIIIGPPGAGKTTALVNSGLRFPLAEKLGKDSVRGVGGTRHCDWWFTDEAVLIDTAGRYTTQDSHQAVDRAAWTGFLDLLKKYRARQPINGAIVAISLSDMATLSDTERFAHAHAVKQRLRELHDYFGVRFPIYVVFTKADLVAGFSEFFDDLGREDRDQVWGTTFKFDAAEAEQGVVVHFEEEFDSLVDRLNERLVERIHQEPDIQRRSLIYGFPQQIASLKRPIQDFLDEIFKPSRYEDIPMLRGFYFTSGTQDGTPIDRLMGTMAQTFGIGRQALSAHSGGGRSYFLTRLLSSVVFAEAGAVTANRKVERRRFWVQNAAYVIAGLVLLGAAGAWVTSYSGNTGKIGEVEESITAYNAATSGLSFDAIEDADLKRVLPALNTLRNMPTGYALQDENVPLSMTLGLYQGDKLGAQARAAYRRGLGSLFLPRLLVRLEGQLRDNINRPDYLYEALKVYLMLGRQGPVDADLVRQWLILDWNTTFPGQVNEGVRGPLMLHLEALLEEPLKQIPLDGNLVERVQQSLRAFPLSERAYAVIKQSPEARELTPWRTSDKIGADGNRVFVRRSGKPLSEAIPGLYTYDGFQSVFLPQVSEVAKEVAQESWVLGPEEEVGLDRAALGRLQGEVMRRYFDDYAAFWDVLIADLAVIPFRDLNHTVDVLNIVSAPNTSPVKLLLLAITRETTLTAPPPASEKNALESAGDSVEAAATKRLESKSKRLANIVGSALAEEGGEVPGAVIDRRYEGLHALSRGEPGTPTQLDGAIARLNELYTQLNQLAISGNQGQAALSAASGAGGGAAQSIQSAASRLPDPLKGWLSALAKSSSSVTVGGARSQIDAAWKSEVLPTCRAALDNRYPVFKDSDAEIALDDFGRLFAPGGKIDGFFATYLKPFVDTSRIPWKWQKVDNVSLGIPDSVLVQFQRASVIRDSLFFGGAQTPGVQFELMPVDLDAQATQVVFDLDGQSISYRHGPQRPSRLKWPGPSGPSQVRVSFAPLVPGQRSSLSREGPWSWFRMLDEASIEKSGLADRFNLTFEVGNRTVTYELRANSVVNPFTLPELQQFRCPPSL